MVKDEAPETAIDLQRQSLSILHASLFFGELSIRFHDVTNLHGMKEILGAFVYFSFHFGFLSLKSPSYEMTLGQPSA